LIVTFSLSVGRDDTLSAIRHPCAIHMDGTWDDGMILQGLPKGLAVTFWSLVQGLFKGRGK
jgi:hypothetical protein